MLRVHYDRGPNFGDSEQIRNKEFTDYPDKISVTNLMRQIIQSGLLNHSVDYDTPQDRDSCYEYWVAPSQVFGFEIIEYKD